MARSRERTRAQAPVRRPVLRAVLLFSLAGLGMLVIVAAITSAVSRRAGTDTATRDALRETQVLARTAIVPSLSDGVLRGEPSAIAALNREVRARVLDKDLVRVKIWRGDGRILYSDATALIGTTYQLGADEQRAIRLGGSAADVSDLSRPENRYERPFHKLLEVYQVVHTPNGTPLLFEPYFRYDAVTAAGQRAWRSFAPILVVALIGLELLQIPLAYSMARRIQRGQQHQEILLRRAIESSDAERRRIASDLHDGVVQDLASVSYSLASLESAVDGEQRVVLREAAAGTRRGIRALRSLLVDIYPPSLRDAGLRAALSDLTAPLASREIATSVDLPDNLRFPPDVEALLFRATQESIRNVVSHARATQVDIRLHRDDHHAVLDVRDDGIGFDAGQSAVAARGGHVGLRVLRDLVEDAGGRLDISSTPGAGTHVRVEVPTP